MKVKEFIEKLKQYEEKNPNVIIRAFLTEEGKNGCETIFDLNNIFEDGSLYIDTTIISNYYTKVSDGDNSYELPINLEEIFNQDCEKILQIKEGTDEWFKACEEFDEKYGAFKI